jgi:hypothetical protein
MSEEQLSEEQIDAALDVLAGMELPDRETLWRDAVD